MTFAHLAGVPFEEWLTPLAASGGAFVLAIRAVLARTRLQREPQRTLGDP